MLVGKNQPFFVYDLRKWNFVSKRMSPELWDQNERIGLVIALRNDYSYDHFSHFLSHCHSISVWLSQTKLSTKFPLKFDAAGSRNNGPVESKAWQITSLDLAVGIGDKNFQTTAYLRRSFPILLKAVFQVLRSDVVFQTVQAIFFQAFFWCGCLFYLLSFLNELTEKYGFGLYW